MCGRYAFFSPSEAVRRTFRLDDVPALEPRYNVAPTQDVPVVRAGEEGAPRRSPRSRRSGTRSASAAASC